jgi:hypothetical protein
MQIELVEGNVWMLKQTCIYAYYLNLIGYLNRSYNYTCRKKLLFFIEFSNLNIIHKKYAKCY